MSDEKIYKLYISKDEKNSGKRIDWKEIGLGVINGLAKADISDFDKVEKTEENRNEKNSFWEEPKVEIKKKEKNDNNKYLKEQEKLEKQLKKEQLKQKVLMNKLQNKKESTISKIDVKNNNKYAFSSPKRTETKFEKMVRKGNENVIKMQNRADNIYGNDEEYRKKYPDSFKNKKHNYFETIRDENKSGSIENNIPDISNPDKLLFKNGMMGDGLWGNIELKDFAKQKESKISNEDILEFLGLDKIKYKLEGNEISHNNQKTKEIIDGVVYPLNTDIEQVEQMRIDAKNRRSERYRLENEEFLKDNVRFKQFLVDNIGRLDLPKKNQKIDTIGDFIHVDIAKLVKEKGYIDEAAENLFMSKAETYLNTEYARKHIIYNNYKDAPIELQEYFRNKIIEQIGEDKLDKTKGILIDENSESSIKLKYYLLSDKNFVEKLKTFGKALNYNFVINSSIDFKKGWHYAIGLSDIRNMHINKDGDLELYIADVYDFNEGETSELVKVGKDRQDKGTIIPYFYAYRVIISKDEIKISE